MSEAQPTPMSPEVKPQVSSEAPEATEVTPDPPTTEGVPDIEPEVSPDPVSKVTPPPVAEVVCEVAQEVDEVELTLEIEDDLEEEETNWKRSVKSEEITTPTEPESETTTPVRSGKRGKKWKQSELSQQLPEGAVEPQAGKAVSTPLPPTYAPPLPRKETTRIVHLYTNPAGRNWGLLLRRISQQPMELMLFYRKSCGLGKIPLNRVDLNYLRTAKTRIFALAKATTSRKDWELSRKVCGTRCVPEKMVISMNFGTGLAKLDWQIPDELPEKSIPRKTLANLDSLRGHNITDFIAGRLPNLQAQTLYADGVEPITSDQTSRLLALATPRRPPPTHLFRFGIVIAWIKPRPKNRLINRCVVELVETGEFVKVDRQHLGIWGVTASKCDLTQVLKLNDFVFLTLPDNLQSPSHRLYRCATNATVGLPFDYMPEKKTYDNYDFHLWLKERDMTVAMFLQCMERSHAPMPLPVFALPLHDAVVTNLFSLNKNVNEKAYHLAFSAKIIKGPQEGTEVICYNDEVALLGQKIGFMDVKGLIRPGMSVYVNIRQILPHDSQMGKLIKPDTTQIKFIATYCNITPSVEEFKPLPYPPSESNEELKAVLTVLSTLSPAEFVKRFEYYNGNEFLAKYNDIAAEELKAVPPLTPEVPPFVMEMVNRMMRVQHDHDPQAMKLISTSKEHETAAFMVSILQTALASSKFAHKHDGTNRKRPKERPVPDYYPPPKQWRGDELRQPNIEQDARGSNFDSSKGRSDYQNWSNPSQMEAHHSPGQLPDLRAKQQLLAQKNRVLQLEGELARMKESSSRGNVDEYLESRRDRFPTALPRENTYRKDPQSFPMSHNKPLPRDPGSFAAMDRSLPMDREPSYPQKMGEGGYAPYQGFQSDFGSSVGKYQTGIPGFIKRPEMKEATLAGHHQRPQSNTVTGYSDWPPTSLDKSSHEGIRENILRGKYDGPTGPSSWDRVQAYPMTVGQKKLPKPSQYPSSSFAQGYGGYM